MTFLPRLSSESGLRRATMAVAATVTAGALLTACSEPAGDGADSTDGDGASGELTLYTSEPEDKVDEVIDAFNEEYPDIDVQVYRAGTGDLTARIDTEKESGGIEADLLWAADAPTFDGYAEDGDLAELGDVDTSDVIDEAQSDNDHYVGTRIIPTVIAYNTSLTEDGGEVPGSWQDLTDSEWDGKIVMPNPAVSGAAAYNAAAWKNTPELGEDWIRALGENNPMIAESNGPTSQEIAGGGHPVGVVVDYLVRDLAAQGSPVEVTYPEEGAPYITEPVGIFDDSDNEDAARAFITFLLSERGQQIAVDQNYLPVREDVGSPEGAPALGDIALLDVDESQVTADKDAAGDLFTDAVG